MTTTITLQIDNNHQDLGSIPSDYIKLFWYNSQKFSLTLQIYYKEVQ